MNGYSYAFTIHYIIPSGLRFWLGCSFGGKYAKAVLTITGRNVLRVIKKYVHILMDSM